MAVGMILLPFVHNSTKNAYSNDVLNLGFLSVAQYDSLVAVEKSGTTVSPDFMSFVCPAGADHYFGPTVENAYGKPVKYVRAKALKRIFAGWQTEFETKIAAIAFVAALPDDWPIALFWT